MRKNIISLLLALFCFGLGMSVMATPTVKPNVMYKDKRPFKSLNDKVLIQFKR